MKLLIKALLSAFFLILFSVACSRVNIPKEGEQFSKLATPVKSALLSPVTEVFSLTCSHCRNMEKYLAQISEQADSEIGKFHITFNRGAEATAQLYYGAEIQLGKAPDPDFMEALFTAIRHGEKKQRQQAIASVFTTHNLISPYLLSDQQNKKLTNKMNEVRNLTKQSNIHSVPTFIINGRYQLLLQGHKTPDEIANTIKYLLTLK